VYIGGQAFMGVTLGAIGILGFYPSSAGAAYAIGALLVVLNFAFNVSVGPGCYTIVGELPATRVRAQTIVIARITYILSSLVVNQLVPRMLSTESWNWGGRCGLFWMGTNILSIVYCFFRLPESRGRTYGELDVLFANKIPARKFASTKVDGEYFRSVTERVSPAGS
jgi:SP family general alpha glucoside:H+ symporter-like MFS transporter